MKKVILKISLAVLFLMVLFANVSFASVPEEDRVILNDILESAVRNGDRAKLSSNSEIETEAYVPYLLIDKTTLTNATGTPRATISGNKIRIENREYTIQLSGMEADRKAFENKAYDELLSPVFSYDEDKYIIVTFFTGATLNVTDSSDIWKKSDGTTYSPSELQLEASGGGETVTIGRSVPIDPRTGEIPVIDLGYDEETELSVFESTDGTHKILEFQVEQTGWYQITYYFEDDDGVQYYYELEYESSTSSDVNNFVQDFSEGIKKLGYQYDQSVNEICYVLYRGKTYSIVVPSNVSHYDLTIERIDEEDSIHGTDWPIEDVLRWGDEYGFMADAINEANAATFFEFIERLMAKLIMSIAKQLLYLIKAALNKLVTLDSIVFNEYEEVRLDFFKTDVYGNSVEVASSKIVNDLREPVTAYYRIFKNIAIVGYLVLLVYIGIRILVSSTAGKKALYKETLLAWITGLIILFFMPYYMKYTIALNDAFVHYIASEDSGLRSARSIEGGRNTDIINSAADKGFIETSFNKRPVGTDEEDVGDLFDFSYQENESYMKTIARLATQSNKLGIAIAFLVIVFQIIMLVVYYYKRAFIVALLIIIFPLIALSYIWDKLNDGKSQALSTWIKEFTINVFVQSFHAIIFVFVSNSIYASLESGGGKFQVDFILLIIASSFLFKGEAILKQIFGGGGDTLGTAAQSGKNIALIVGGTMRVGTRVIKKTLGKDGIIRGTVHDFQKIHRDVALRWKPRNQFDEDGRRLARKDRQTRFDMLAKNAKTTERINALLPASGPVSNEIREAAEMIDTFNNWGNVSDKKLAKALKTYEKLKKANLTDTEQKQFNAMMKKCSLNADKIERLQKAVQNMSAAAAKETTMDKETTKKITQNLRLEVEAIFVQTDDSGKRLTGKDNQMADKFLKASLRNVSLRGASKERKTDKLEEQYKNKQQKMKKVYHQIEFVTSKGALLTYDESEKQAKTRADDLMDQLKRTTKKGKIVNEEKTKTAAKHIAILEQATQGKKINATQAMQAVTYLENNKDLIGELYRLSNMEMDLQTMSYLLSKKIASGDKWLDKRRENIVGTAQAEQEALLAKKAAENYVEQVEEKARKNLEGYGRYDSRENTRIMKNLYNGIHFATNFQYSNSQERAEARVNTIMNQFKKKSLTGTYDEKEAKLVAESIVVVEQLIHEGGIINTSRAVNAVNLLREKKAIWEKMRDYSTIPLNMDEMGYVIYKKVDALPEQLDVSRVASIGMDAAKREATEAKAVAHIKVEEMARRMEPIMNGTAKKAGEAERSKVERIYEQIHFATVPRDDSLTRDEMERRIVARTDEVMSWLRSTSTGAFFKEKETRAVARNFAIVEQLLENENVSTTEAMKAIKGLEGQDELWKQMTGISSIDTDLGTMRYLVCKKVYEADGSKDMRSIEMNPKVIAEKERARLAKQYAEEQVNALHSQFAFLEGGPIRRSGDSKQRQKAEKVYDQIQFIAPSEESPVTRFETERRIVKRTDELVKWMQTNAPDAFLKEKETQSVARNMATIEVLLQDGGVNVTQAMQSVQELKGQEALWNRMEKASSIDLDLNTTRYVISKKASETIESDDMKRRPMTETERDIHEAKRYATEEVHNLESRVISSWDGPIRREEDERERKKAERVYEKIHFATSMDESTMTREEADHQASVRAKELMDRLEHKGLVGAWEKDELSEVAKDVAMIEQLLEGRNVSVSQAMDVVESLEGKEQYWDKVSQISDVELKLDTTRYIISKKASEMEHPEDLRAFASEFSHIDQEAEWARREAEEFVRENAYQEAEFNKPVEERLQENDPYISILNVLEVAESNKEGALYTFDEMIEHSGYENASTMLERKTEAIRRLNQKEITMSREFAENALKWEDFGTYEDKEVATLDGRTMEDVKTMTRADVGSFASHAIGNVLDVGTVPVTSFVGGVIGAAVTDDGMPLEEATIGINSGYYVGAQVSDSMVPFLSREEYRTKKITELEKTINKRIKADTKAQYKAEKNYTENVLKILGANANLHVEPDGKLSASIHIMAENAAFVRVSEQASISNSGWEAFSENVYYVFQDNDPAKERNLYIYVKDASGNMKGARINGIRL